MFNWFNNLFSNKNSINNRSKTTTPNNSNNSNNIKSLEDATMAYILSKYKKESYKIMREHILSANIEGLNQDRMDELKKFLESILLVVEDDFLKGYRLLKGRMVKIDQYVFSQYKKDPLLKNNIYKVLYFASNRRFSNNVKENLTAYFALIEELGFEVILFLEDYHKTMEELEKNPRASIHLKKNYGLQNFVKKDFEDSIDSINEQSIQFLTTDSIATQTKYITPFINNDNEVNNNNNNNTNTTSSYVGAHSSSSSSNTLEEKIEAQLKELNNNKNHNNDYSNDSIINLDLDAPTK